MSAYNPELRTLDQLLFRRPPLWPPWPPSKAVPWGISLTTWSPWTHAGTVVKCRLHGSDVIRTCIFDAPGGYLDLRPLSADIRRGAVIAVRRPLDGYTVDEQGVADFVWENWGQRAYATVKMVNNLPVLVAGGANRPDPKDIPERFFCSELNSCLLRRFGRTAAGAVIDPCPERADRYTAPAHIARSTRLRWLTQHLTTVNK